MRTVVLMIITALLLAGCGGTFVDSRDGTTYRKVRIGSQTWMAENLNYDVPDDTTDVCYDNKADHCEKYGRLYSWYTAIDGIFSSSTVPSGIQGVCPAGWHVPSNAEWSILENHAGGANEAAVKLKPPTAWYYDHGTDRYGFSALPGGSCCGKNGGFYDAGNVGYWWSTTGHDGRRALHRTMFSRSDYVQTSPVDKELLMSVRCLRDGF